MPNYANGSIYKIWSLSTDEIYIGSTTEPLSKRMTKHRHKYKKYKEGKNPGTTSFKIFEYGDARIELIETFDCKCKEELVAREGHYIRTLDCVNYYTPGRTKKEYYEDNKEKIALNKKKYREKNKEKIALNKKKYHEDNKEKISLNKKKYREANRDKIIQKKKEYYQNNKDRLTKKITCECGSVVSKKSLTRHKKSKKHLAFINSLN